MKEHIISFCVCFMKITVKGTCGFSWPRSKIDYEEVERTAEPASEGPTSLRVRGVTSGHKVLTKHC